MNLAAVARNNARHDAHAQTAAAVFAAAAEVETLKVPNPALVGGLAQTRTSVVHGYLPAVAGARDQTSTVVALDV